MNWLTFSQTRSILLGILWGLIWRLSTAEGNFTGAIFIYLINGYLVWNSIIFNLFQKRESHHLIFKTVADLKEKFPLFHDCDCAARLSIMAEIKMGSHLLVHDYYSQQTQLITFMSVAWHAFLTQWKIK